MEEECRSAEDSRGLVQMKPCCSERAEQEPENLLLTCILLPRRISFFLILHCLSRNVTLSIIHTNGDGKFVETRILETSEGFAGGDVPGDGMYEGWRL